MSASFNRASYISPLRGKTPIITPSRDLTASSFIKTICLYNWWLVNANDESNRGKLRVSGIGSKDGQSKRVFISAAISKRCDMVTLEAVDGFIITLIGFINRSVTQDNGFTVEVCNCFHFGFPVNWKDYASFDENNVNSSVTSELWPLAMPMDDMPVTLIRDILVLGRGGSSIQMKLEKNAFDDLVQISGEGMVSNKNVTQSDAREVKNKVLKTGVMTRSMSKQNRPKKENRVVDNATISDSKRGGKDDSCQNPSRKRLDVDWSFNDDGVEGMFSVRRSSRIKALRNL